MDSIAELSAALSTAAVKDQQQADFIRMMQNLKLLKRFRPEAVVMAVSYTHLTLPTILRV